MCPDRLSELLFFLNYHWHNMARCALEVRGREDKNIDKSIESTYYSELCFAVLVGNGRLGGRFIF